MNKLINICIRLKDNHNLNILSSKSGPKTPINRRPENICALIPALKLLLATIFLMGQPYMLQIIRIGNRNIADKGIPIKLMAKPFNKIIHLPLPFIFCSGNEVIR
jgi:hypothetical protein